jgi:hypothetical protein
VQNNCNAVLRNENIILIFYLLASGIVQTTWLETGCSKSGRSQLSCTCRDVLLECSPGERGGRCCCINVRDAVALSSSSSTTDTMIPARSKLIMAVTSSSLTFVHILFSSENVLLILSYTRYLYKRPFARNLFRLQHYKCIELCEYRLCGIQGDSDRMPHSDLAVSIVRRTLVLLFFLILCNNECGLFVAVSINRRSPNSSEHYIILYYIILYMMSYIILRTITAEALLCTVSEYILFSN